MARRPYSRSELAKFRKEADLTQEAACPLLGLKAKQHLSQIETGRVMASTAVMKAMAEAYRRRPEDVLRAAVNTFESGVLLEKHRRRQLKVAGLPHK